MRLGKRIVASRCFSAHACAFVCACMCFWAGVQIKYKEQEARARTRDFSSEKMGSTWYFCEAVGLQECS